MNKQKPEIRKVNHLNDVKCEGAFCVSAGAVAQNANNKRDKAFLNAFKRFLHEARR